MKKTTTVYDKGVSSTYEYELDDSYFYDIIDGVKSLKKELGLLYLKELNGEYLKTSGWPIYHEDMGHCGLCGRLGCRGECQGGS